MKRIKTIIFLCFAFMVASGITIPKKGLCMTIAQEEALAKEFMKVVIHNYKFVKDPLILDYVDRVGRRILSGISPQPYPYHFYIIQEDVYNAFAGPAGHIFINSGLIEAMEGEAELAGILAHEIAHVVARHISQKLERSKKIQMATLAGIVAGIFLGSGGASTAANAITVGSVAANQSIALAYSREDEMQADQLGLEYLKKANYDGRGLLTALAKIRSRQWFGSDQIPNYLMTHPASEERMAYVGSWVETHPVPESHVNPADFKMAHIRLVALYGDKDSAMSRFASDVKNQPGNAMAHYGYGLALARTGNYQDAVTQLKKALEKDAFNPAFLIDLGRIYFLDGRYPVALNTLQSTVPMAPHNPVGQFFLGRTQLALNRLKDAEATFITLIEKHPRVDRAFFFLSEVYGAQEKLADAHYYRAIYYQKIGRMKNARFHLKTALKKTDDPDRRQKIKEMLKEIKETGDR